MSEWVRACAAGDIDNEDLVRFDHGDRSYAVYRSPDDEYFCTDAYIFSCHTKSFFHHLGAEQRARIHCDDGGTVIPE